MLIHQDWPAIRPIPKDHTSNRQLRGKHRVSDIIRSLSAIKFPQLLTGKAEFCQVLHMTLGNNYLENKTKKKNSTTMTKKIGVLKISGDIFTV